MTKIKSASRLELGNNICNRMKVSGTRFPKECKTCYYFLIKLYCFHANALLMVTAYIGNHRLFGEIFTLYTVGNWVLW